MWRLTLYFIMHKAPPSERKIVKLCEYAAKNPFRIPKIAKYLEERCYKELRCEHIKFINIVSEAYNKLLCLCKEQMAYFAVSLLNVVSEMMDSHKKDAVRIIGCQTFTRFIYSQVDGTYTYNIEILVDKVCTLARESGEDHEKRCLRAASLQCLSAMIVHVTLDNYGPDPLGEDDDERGEPHHNWVDEVVRCEGRTVAGVGSEISSCTMLRPRAEKKDPSLLSREEIETPKVWAQICIQKMVELAKESITMRLVLDPMFIYFDTKRYWVPRHGLAIMVLSDMCYFVENPGNQQFILSTVIHHLDHKNVSHDPQVKPNVVQIATSLARQIRSEAVLTDSGFICDLCRHLRKSLQATVDSVGEEVLNLNISLQNTIEDCLLEIVKGILDSRPIFDMMAITLEKLPSVKVVAKATIDSLIILAHVVSLASVSSLSQQVFPEALLVQLVKIMLHHDVEVRAGAHQIFSALLVLCSNSQHGIGSKHPRRWQSDSASPFASIKSLLERLRREKDGTKVHKPVNNVQDNFKDREVTEEEWKQGRAPKNSSNFHKISSIIDKTTKTTSWAEAVRICFPFKLFFPEEFHEFINFVEPSILKFSEDQVAQLLSAFWVQANLPDNLPFNIEAIAHSYYLTLLSLRFKNSKNNVVVRFFQLPLSLRNTLLDPNNGTWPPAYQRTVLILSTAMLTFAAKMYQILDLIDLVKSLVEYEVDPYLGISDDFQVYVKPWADVREFGSAADNKDAASLLHHLRNQVYETDKIVVDSLVQSLSGITEDFTTNLMAEDDLRSESSVADLSRFIPHVAASPSMPHIISIGQLLESVLEVAGQVAGTSISTSPLPYSAMASQCEALGTGARQRLRLSSWLTRESHYSKTSEKLFPAISTDGLSEIKMGGMLPMDPWLALKLPPASPFDNFLRAARY
ncbi:hypothetical protein RHMOL_Rhmol05G0180500 [Rhododendron molle]|uniref:Uncharacterized protein n=3 Tax=Rhododendron molle TaxID=49168 RepID=A0ACC0NQH6_RHOML|nr:hypothetical protein RHMOL_Rhmol05G0180500 [Rhododendron molle]KAI8555543.1 hypothetical protein RHMOL_Rhmol05G0180500 [Rhododendron molle]KAI8555545.1 hypothetical protein RHMOL_Rhmol05G0180500 [Rhododendron molle]